MSVSSATATASASGNPRLSAPSCGRCSAPALLGRAFPRLPHQQLDRAGRVAAYIARENIAPPSIYYTHKRDVVGCARACWYP